MKIAVALDAYKAQSGFPPSPMGYGLAKTEVEETFVKVALDNSLNGKPFVKLSTTDGSYYITLLQQKGVNATSLEVDTVAELVTYITDAIKTAILKKTNVVNLNEVHEEFELEYAEKTGAEVTVAVFVYEEIKTIWALTGSERLYVLSETNQSDQPTTASLTSATSVAIVNNNLIVIGSEELGGARALKFNQLEILPTSEQSLLDSKSAIALVGAAVKAQTLNNGYISIPVIRDVLLTYGVETEDEHSSSLSTYYASIQADIAENFTAYLGKVRREVVGGVQ